MRRQTKEVTAADYVRYAATRSPRLRCRLLEANLPLVHAVAASVSRSGVPLEIGDLEAWGTIGLCDALEKYDPAKGNRLATYATPRIRGAIIDAIRKADWVPRLVRQRGALVERARAGRELGRAGLLRAVGRELAKQTPCMRATLGTAKRVVEDASPPSVDSLSAPAWWNDSREVKSGELLGAPPESDSAEAADWWRWVLAGFSRQENLILTLIYRAGLTLKETGRAIGISESRVSQLRPGLLMRLRARVEESEAMAA